jgi:hypothetical protein
MPTDRHSEGPSPSLMAWRRFLIETLVCLVLVAAIITVVLDARHSFLTGATILPLAAFVVGVVRYR